MTTQLLLSKDWRSFSMRAFVKEHRRWFTFVGALIVFLTFISKEVLREHWSALAESVEKVETTVEVRKDIDGLGVEVRSVARNTHAIYNMVSEERQDAYIARSHMSRAKKKFMIETEPDYSELDEFDEMVTGMTSGRKKLEMLKSLIAQLPDHAARERSRQALIEEVGNFLPEPYSYPKGELVDTKIDEFIVSNLNDARTKRDYWRTWSDRFDWASIAFYCLGWGLGFVGKIYGVEAESGE